MNLRERFPNNQRCIERCDKIAICRKLIAKGDESLEKAKTAPGYSTSGPDFETDDGRHVSYEEFIGRPSQKQDLQEAGEALVSSGDNLMQMLLEACPEGGPIELTHPSPNGPTEDGSIEWVDGATHCQSAIAAQFMFTNEDLEL